MAVPDFQALMLPVLKCAAQGEMTVSDCVQKAIEEFNLSSDEVNKLLPSGKQTYLNNRTHWAKFYLSRAKLVELVSRGRFRITQRGKDLLATAPTKISKKTLETYPEYLEWWNSVGSNPDGGQASAPIASASTSDSSTPEEEIEASHRALLAQLKAEIIDRVQTISPAAFEQLIIDLLLKMGYGGGRADMGEAIGKPGDGVIDGVIKEDPLGLDIVYIQAKRYASDHAIGRPEIQNFSGSLDGVGATKGIYVTSSSFTTGARDYAKKIAKRIILIDGADLARLMIQHNIGVRMKATFEIKKVDEDYFNDE